MDGTVTAGGKRGNKVQRDFCFVPYGASFAVIGSAFPDQNNSLRDDRPSISCDGRVTRGDNHSGTPHLELTHWTNHQTPTELYADTSTEIALNFVKNSKASK
jgi:hypothetical protein